jgi:hypothetical protein
MDNNLFETLLRENEGVSLDYKKGQYKFAGATDEEKGEILKDILAFCNAWRRSEAYVLIGVEEDKSGTAAVCGVTNHLNDHELQQFVNGKTQKPVRFSYSVFSYQEKSIGILEIPVQDRPAFLTKNYGKLHKNAVYVRRGSSTVEANPDEISKMGLTAEDSEIDLNIELGLYDPIKSKFLGNDLVFKKSTFTLSDKIPDYDRRKIMAGDAVGLSGILNSPNPNFYRELIRLVQFESGMSHLSFYLKNNSRQTIRNPRAEILIVKSKKIRVLHSDEKPKTPEEVFNPLLISPEIYAGIGKNEIDIKRINDLVKVEVSFKDVQPKATQITSEFISLGILGNARKHLEAKVFADNLPDPVKFSFVITFKTSTVKMSSTELIRNLIVKGESK